MSKVNELFEKELCVVNFGIESFYQDLKKQNVKLSMLRGNRWLAEIKRLPVI